MALEDLRSKIKDLKFLIENGNFSPGDPFNAKDIADNIKQLCEEVLSTSSHFPYFLSSLFSMSDEYSLFFVLKLMLKHPQFDDSICNCLDALTTIVLKTETGQLDEFVSEIVQLCLRVVNKEVLKSKREAGYTLLTAILEISCGKFNENDLKIEEIIKFCHSQLETLKKSENAGVKKGLYQLMGLLCKLFPEKLVQPKRNYGSSFAAVLAAEMKSQMASTTKTPMYGILEACFTGFNGVLCNFSDVLTAGRISLRQLYDYCKMVVDPENQLSRHGPSKAALTLLLDHAILFRDQFLIEFKVLFKYFQFWAMHSDRDLRVLGLRSTEMLFKQVADMLPEQLEKSVADGERVYLFFVEKFRNSLQNTVGVREIAMAVKGFGYFAQATKCLYGVDGLLKLIRDITSRSENIFLNSPEPLEQKVTYIPHFLEATASAMAFLDEVPIDVWPPLETLHVLLYQHFPLLDKKYFFSAVLASFRVFLRASSRNTNYLDRIINQSLIRLFSLSPASVVQATEADLGVTSTEGARDPKNLVYKDYLPLWTILISAKGLKVLDEDFVDDVADQLFDSLIRFCMEIIGRLDLEAQKISLEDDEENNEFNPSSQPLMNLQPKKRNDFWIFINLVDFLRDLLTPLKRKRFEKWISTFIRFIIEYATKYPLISGFYKLITLALSLANDLNYFQIDIIDRNQTIALLKRFIDEVIIRMKQFKDDLLVSCLQLILKMPLLIVASSIGSLSEAIRMSLKLGLTYLPLAENCLDALELWNDNLSVDQLKSLYDEILPNLDEYLQSEQVGGDNEGAFNNQDVDKAVSRRKRKKGVDKKKIVDQKISMKNSPNLISESKLANIRHRILLFVGRLGGQLNHRLIDQDARQLAELCTSWDTVEHLHFDVPFSDMKPTIVLDQFLPRLCALATSSGDRQTKIAACESLHSIILYILGKNSQQNQSQREREPMHKLYRRLFPVLLQLCCDADEVPKELFRVLTDQIIHWFSSNVSYENPETVALLDSLLEGAEISSDAVVRDYSARCVDEFLKWSIKHSTKAEGSPMENNVRSLFKRLYRFASHPLCEKRLAASLIFNAIYRTFREENELVNKFSIEILTVYLNSLALAHHDDESEGTVDQCVQVVCHLERIFVKRSEIFLKNDANRRVPTGWEEATLEELVKYLFNQIGRLATMFRQKSFELFERLTPLVITIGGPRQFFASVLRQHGRMELIHRFEGKANSDCEGGIFTNPRVELSEETSLQDVLLYLERILAALDCYFASLNASLIDVEALFSIQNLKELKLFESISFYLESVFGRDLNDIVKNLVFTPKDVKNFNKSKCTVFVRLLQFYTVLVNKCSDTLLKNLPAFVWPRRLFEHSLVCCFDSSRLGFDLSMKDTVVHLPLVLRPWITAVGRRLPAKIKEVFTNSLTKLISNDFKFVPLKELLSKNDADWFFADNLLKGYSLLNSCQVLPTAVRPEATELWRCFVDVCAIVTDEYSYLREWSPSSLSFVKSYLKLVSELGVKAIDVVIAITDSTAVKLSRSSTQSTLVSRGGTLLDQFGDSISLLAVKDADNFATNLINIGDDSQVGSSLCKVLDCVGKDLSLRKNYGEKFVKIIVDQCHKRFADWITDNADAQAKSMWIAVVQKMAVIESKVFTTPGPVSDEFFDCFCHILSDKGANLNFKCKALMLLGLFGISRNERDSKLKLALNSFVVNEFPLKSNEFTKGTQESDEYLTAIRRMLYALTINENNVILEVLVNLLCRENEHVAEEELTDLLKSYTKRVTSAHWYGVISIPLDIFWGENADYSDEHRLNALEKLLLPMLSGSDSQSLKQFFIKNLNFILEKLDSTMSHYSDAVYKNQLITKLGCWNLLELMYSKLDVAVLKGEINEKFVGKISQDKNELIKKLFKTMPEARKEGRYDSNLINLKWQYRCAVHNCLIAILMATQTKSQVFEGYIFKDAWDYISEPTKTYFFDVDVSVLPKRQKQILSMRRSTSDSQDDSAGVNVSSNSTLQFLSTQFLADSSLRSELTNYDFTTSLVSGSTQSSSDSQPSTNFTNQIDRWNGSNSNETDEVSFEMENDELNNHPSMKLTMAVIRYLVDKKITPINPQAPGEMPTWMKYILKQLESQDLNTKLFVARLVTLLEDIFCHFAKQFLMPLIRLLLDPDCGPNGLHVFRIDILATMLGWSQKAVPDRSELQKHLCSELLEYLMVHAPSSNSSVLRRNIQILNLTLELWPDCFIVEPNLILKYLASPDKNEANIAVGIQILGVVLRNKLNPLGVCIEESKKTKLYGSLTQHIDHKSAKIYKPAAEVLGLSLKYLSEQVDVEGLELRVQTVLSKLIQQGNVGRSKFLECLQAIQRHYPKFSDRFLKDVLALLPNVHGDYKTLCLEIICGRAEFVPNLFDDLKTRGLNTLLVIRDEGRQLWTLNIIYKIIDKLSISDIRDVVSTLAAFVDHPHTECRLAVAEIFFRLYDLWSGLDSDDAKIVIDYCRETLLKFLNDNEPTIRQIVYNFWSHETRLSTEPVKRLTKIISLTYSPNTEREFLAHATYLLLELTSRSPDFRRELFDKPLTECKFEDFKVVTNWRRRYASLQTPAFADSQIHGGIGGTQEAHGHGTHRELRATIANPAQFTQTQISGGRTYDWMTGGSYDTFAETAMIPDGAADNVDLTELMFRQKKDKFQHIRAVPRDFGKNRLTSAQTVPETMSNQNEIKNELKRLKRRILKDKTQTGFFFARMETRRKQNRERLETERKSAREQNVSLYRTYRVGDFPDIQILHAALLTPLQAVAQRDSIVAGRLFESLMSAIYVQVKKVEPDEDLIDLSKKLTDGIDLIMKSTTVYYGPLMSSLMIFCYNNATMVKIDDQEMKISSINSHQQKLGIVLLEKYLMTDGAIDQRPPEKKARRALVDVDGDPQVVSSWIELSKLYKSLDDGDTVRTIFMYNLNTKEVTKKALELESKGRLSEAIKIYTDALRNHYSIDNSFNELETAEAECWEESRLQCLNDLNEWKDLADVTERSIDDNSPPNLSKIWDDQYLQEFYLPFLLRAKLKLVVNGDLSHKSIIDFVDQSLIDPEKRSFFQDRHPFSIALIDFMKHDYQKIRYDCNKMLQKFLRDWSSLNSMDSGAKKHLLQETQRLSEMINFLDYNEKKTSKIDSLIDLMDFWLAHSPDFISDEANVWDDVMQMRSLYVEEMCSKFVEKGLSKEDFYKKTFSHEIRMKLQLVRSATLQRNFPVAFSQLQSTKQMLNFVRNEDSSLPIEYCRQYAETQFVFLDDDQNFSKDNIDRLLTVLDLCEKFRSVLTDKEKNRQLLLKARTVEKIGWIFYKSESIPIDFSSEVVDKINKNGVDIDFKSFSKAPAGALFGSAFDLYQKAADFHLPNDLWQPMIEFCDNILRQHEEGFNESCPADQIDAAGYAGCLVDSLLKAMQDGSADARLMFPRLMQILEVFPSTANLFVKLTDNIPCWMFLKWLNQIVALLDKSFGSNLFNIVNRIADEYPNALVYPILLSKENYRFEKETEKHRKFVEKLSSKMKEIPLVKSFVDNLVLLSQPDLLIKDCKNELIERSNHAKSKEELKSIMKDFHDGIFSKNVDDSSLGDHWKKYFNCKEKFDKKFGDNFVNFANATSQERNKLWIEFYDFYHKLMPDEPPKQLDKYSRWLAQFSSDKQGALLEIPGQYTGDTKPIPGRHVFVYAFDAHVRVFTSIRKPISITMLGNDGREYPYLVKSGEDLRQDHRVEQIFEQMNGILHRDAECSKRAASIRTYAVVPLTTKVGLIELMPDVETLKDFMLKKVMTKVEQKKFTVHIREHCFGNKFYGDLPLDAEAKDCYWASYSKFPHLKAGECLRKAEKSTPKHLLRQAVLRLCLTPDAFFVLRQHFTVSHAVLCVAHYLLGIGDRHLSNFMIDLRTATMIGIDFGYAFGTTIQSLPVPELMPFRLTMQICQMFDPVGVRGSMQAIMGYCMRAFRENSKLLLNTMDVFVKEPALNWTQDAKRLLSMSSSVSGSDLVDLSWYPKQKLETARRKLAGDNPVVVIEQELRQARTNQRHAKVQFPLEKVVEVIYGCSEKLSETDKKRPRGYSSDKLSVEDQVRCLIEMATDPVILARVYYGWEPWL